MFEQAARDLAENAVSEKHVRRVVDQDWNDVSSEARRDAERATRFKLVVVRPALRLIWQVVEMHAPPDSLRNPEHMPRDVPLEAKRSSKAFWRLFGRKSNAMANGIVTLGGIAETLPTLEMKYDRCGRCGIIVLPS